MCAAFDMEMIKRISMHVSDEDNDDFRVTFLNWFQNPSETYYLNTHDPRAELKAFLLIVTMTLLNVCHIQGRESCELKLFFKVFAEEEYFSEATRSVIALLFGFVASEVRWKKLV